MTDAGLGPPPPLRRRILVFVGRVGAGKGTQAALLSRSLALPVVATGDLFRRAVREQTDLGRRAESFMARGELVPDEITTALVAEQLAAPDAARGLILDGFPRTAAQAAALDALLTTRGEAVERALYVEVPTDELVARVAGRQVCPTCGTPYHAINDPPRVPGICDREGTPLITRDDDRPEVVRARLEGQAGPMLEVVAHYRDRGQLSTIDGNQPIDAVTAAVHGAIGR